MRLNFAAFVFFLTLPIMLNVSVAKAEDGNSAGIYGNLNWFRIGTSRPIRLETNDQISDGCWTSVVATQNTVKLELQRSNIEFTDAEEVSATYLMLNAIGYETNDYSCVAYISLIASSFLMETTEVGNEKLLSGDFPVFWQSGALLSGSKSGMANRIKNKAVELTQSFILSISAERKRIRNELENDANLTKAQKVLWDSYITIALEGKAN